MALSKKSVSMLIILGLVSACLTLYTVSVYSVARYAIDGDWRYSPSGSFLPWPRGPGPTRLPVLTKMNETDLFIYRYLIKSWVLVGVTIILWVVTSLYVLKVTRLHSGN